MHKAQLSDSASDVPEEPPSIMTPAAPPVITAPIPAPSVFAALQDSPNWQDWQWHMRNRIRSLAQFKSFFPGIERTMGVYEALKRFQMAITPYYAALIERLDESDPVFRMAVPSSQELYNPPFLQADPLEEDHDMPVPGLVHRYNDRALIVATSA